MRTSPVHSFLQGHGRVLKFSSVPDPFRTEAEPRWQWPLACLLAAVRRRHSGGAHPVRAFSMYSVSIHASHPLSFLTQGWSVTRHTFSCPIESHLFMISSVECKFRWVGQLGVGVWKSRSQQRRSRQAVVPNIVGHLGPAVVPSGGCVSLRLPCCVQRYVRSTCQSTVLHIETVVITTEDNEKLSARSATWDQHVLRERPPLTSPCRERHFPAP